MQSRQAPMLHLLACGGQRSQIPSVPLEQRSILAFTVRRETAMSHGSQCTERRIDLATPISFVPRSGMHLCSPHPTAAGVVGIANPETITGGAALLTASPMLSRVRHIAMTAMSGTLCAFEHYIDGRCPAAADHIQKAMSSAPPGSGP